MITMEDAFNALNKNESLYILIPDSKNWHWRELYWLKIQYFSIRKESLRIEQSLYVNGNSIKGENVSFYYVFKTKEELIDFFLKEVREELEKQ